MSPQFVTAAEAVLQIPAGARIYIEGGVGHPASVVRALMDVADVRGPFEIVTSVMGELPLYCDPAHAEHFRVKSFRGSPEMAGAYRAGQADVIPVGLSRIPSLLADQLRPDVAIVQVSPPDHLGQYSLGVSVLYHRAAIDAARLVIAVVNRHMPRTCGDSGVNAVQFDLLVEAEDELPSFSSAVPSENERSAAGHAAAFVPDGATVQIGMGAFADAVLKALADRRQLRVHAGLLSGGILDLMSCGAVEDTPGAVTTGALAAAPHAYRRVEGDERFHFRGVDYTHAPKVLADLPSFVAINSVLEVDYTGQSNGDTLRGVPISGAGGALDFAHAACSGSGLSILALTTTSRSGHQRVRPALTEPSVVSLPRTEIDIIATEHGAVDLRGIGLRDRERLIASIAGGGA